MLSDRKRYTESTTQMSSQQVVNSEEGAEMYEWLGVNMIPQEEIPRKPP